MYVDKFRLFLWLKAGTSDCCCPGCWRREVSKAVWYRYFFWWFGEHRRILLTVFSKVVGPFFVVGYFCCCCSDFFSRNVCISASGVYTRCFRWTSPDWFWRCLPLPVSILVICLNESRLILSGTYFGFVFRFRCLYSLSVFNESRLIRLFFRFRCLYSFFSLDESRLFNDIKINFW